MKPILCCLKKQVTQLGKRTNTVNMNSFFVRKEQSIKCVFVVVAGTEMILCSSLRRLENAYAENV